MSAETAASTRTPEPPRRPAERRRALGRIGASLRRAWLALAVYATVRAAGIVCVVLGARQAGKQPRTQLGHYWDSRWYVGIAQHGYGTNRPSVTHPGLTFSDLAFFPLYPALIRAVTAVVPVSGVTAGLLVAWGAAGLAAWGIHAVGELLYGRRVALTLVALWGLLPHAVIESMGYTESLLTALAAWSLYALLTGRPLWAGALALCAGATRPNGLAVAAAVCACAAAEIRRHRWRTSWRVWAGAALSPLGWLGYAVWVGVRRGTWRGYLDVQDDWGTYLDLGASGFRSARSLIMGDGYLSHYMALVVIGAALISLVGFVLRPPPLPLVVYTLALVFIALASAHYFASKPRFLLPAFPLLIPAALAMARARPRTAVLVGGALAGLSCLYGTYLLTMATSPV
ncbi:hypothetical protein [Streptomyces rugosispiralis]|uniref:Integral membrane protein n=1 Tax=Streptomyces rugosispiralis TaxID=2967341 RepID=A0ABT1V8E4_9ACTN|nr:hypothetical protein [Streptomyces rugosispiralis]MCQ8192796.1 hypothetical protein [Streptomyces rugosispiralis]